MPLRNESGRGRVFSRRVVVGICLTSMCCLVVSAFVTAAVGFDDEETAADPGLRGILAEYSPDGLSQDAFSVLDGNWAEWAEETTADVRALYAAETAEAQREAIDKLQSRIRVMDRALEDERYAKLHDHLTVLRGRLWRRVAVAEAALDTLALDPEAARQKRVRDAREDVVATARELRDELRSIRDGEPWFEFVNGPQLLNLADEETEVGSMLDVLRDTRKQFGRRDSFTEAQQEFLDRESFDALDSAVEDLLTAVDSEPAATEGLREALAELVGAIEEYEDEETAENARLVREAIVKIKSAAPDGGERLMSVLLEGYLNFNLRVVVSEDFASKFVEEQRTDRGPVRDYLLGTDVYGRQTTYSDVDVDFVPDNREARLNIVVDGRVKTRTTGYNPDATLFTVGNHQFRARKTIRFDGDRFEVEPARIGVDANNNTYAARTKISGLPLFGSIADSIAVSEARRNRPIANAHAAMRLRQRVLPEFDESISEQQLNDEIASPNRRRLQETGLYPDYKRYRTTSDKLLLSSRTLKPTELGGGLPSETHTPDEGVTIHLHESLVNNTFDRMGIAGKTLTETELREHIADFFSRLTGREIEVDPPEKEDPSQFVLSKTDPMRIKFDEGRVELTIRTGLKRPDEDDIPEQVVTVPLEYDVSDGKIKVTRGRVQVSIKGGIAVAAVLRRRVQTAIPEEETHEAKFDVEFETDGQQKKVPAEVSAIKALNGWLVINAR